VLLTVLRHISGESSSCRLRYSRFFNLLRRPATVSPKGMALIFHINANQQRRDVRKLWYLIFDQVNAPVVIFLKAAFSCVKKV
jgi:hypothetical protein